MNSLHQKKKYYPFLNSVFTLILLSFFLSASFAFSQEQTPPELLSRAMIVLGSTMKSADQLIQEKSWHYLIKKNGEIIHLVDDKQLVEPIYTTVLNDSDISKVSIFVAYADTSFNTEPSPEQYKATDTLYNRLKNKYVSLDFRGTIITMPKVAVYKGLDGSWLYGVKNLNVFNRGMTQTISILQYSILPTNKEGDYRIGNKTLMQAAYTDEVVVAKKLLANFTNVVSQDASLNSFPAIAEKTTILLFPDGTIVRGNDLKYDKKKETEGFYNGVKVFYDQSPTLNLDTAFGWVKTIDKTRPVDFLLPKDFDKTLVHVIFIEGEQYTITSGDTIKDWNNLPDGTMIVGPKSKLDSIKPGDVFHRIRMKVKGNHILFQKGKQRPIPLAEQDPSKILVGMKYLYEEK